MATRPASSPTDNFFRRFDEELTDPANLELMVDAVTLPCQHRVNEDTALRILNLGQEAEHRCPTCRAPFVNYVIDTTMRSLARERQRLQQGDLPANTTVERNTPRPTTTTTAALQSAGSSTQRPPVAPPREVASTAVSTYRQQPTGAPVNLLHTYRAPPAPLPVVRPVPPTSHNGEPVNPLYVPVTFNFEDLALPGTLPNGNPVGLPRNPNYISAAPIQTGRLPTYTENLQAAAGSMVDWLHMKIVGY